ncbi:MAG: aminotransferase class I/II-fold pyridoxal phosphate-dependent enzyme [Phycisphaeraceae bacterium]
MFQIGQEEIDAVARVIRSGNLFRYHEPSECGRFEQRYAKYLSAQYVGMTASGTGALTAALVGLGVGPGDEVIVPAHTYMATAVAVVAVGAIPVIVDIDESICLDPAALEDAIGPHTRAVIPVHMWGQVCDMEAILRIAEKHNLLVVEDACQAVGGGYRGRMAGTLGHAGAFSFNHFKNMTCGEGGAVVTDDARVFQRAQCAIDCHRYYWNDREANFTGFAFSGARASEIEGAILNVQLDRLPAMMQALRDQKTRILGETRDAGLIPVPLHSPDHECGAVTMFALPTAPQADAFAHATGGTVLARTGRHTYNEWDPILHRQGGPTPVMNAFELPQNQRCRMNYAPDMCPRSLAILRRTVSLANHPDHTPQQVAERVQAIRDAASQVLGDAAHAS